MSKDHGVRHPVAAPVFLTRKKVRVGFRGSAENFMKDLERRGIWIDDRAIDMVKRVQFEKTASEVALTFVPINMLGFLGGVRLSAIYDRANQCGLGLVSPEAGLELRLEYADQPANERIYIAMKPIDGYILSLYSSEPESYSRVLSGEHVDLERVWNIDCWFVFALPERRKLPRPSQSDSRRRYLP